jgi:hypothetical protein
MLFFKKQLILSLLMCVSSFYIQSTLANITTSKPPATSNPSSFVLTPFLEKSEKTFRRMMQDIDNPYTEHTLWKHFYVSALFNVDTSYQFRPDYLIRNHHVDVDLATAKLNLATQFNSWIKAQVGLFYSTDDERYYEGQYQKHGLDWDEAYVLIKNFSQSPIYFKLGKQYLSFGRYHRYAIYPSLPQRLSELRKPAINMGFVTSKGVYGSAFLFPGKKHENEDYKRRVLNYGFSLGVDLRQPVWQLDLGVDGLYNMVDVGEIRNVLFTQPFYHHRVPAAAVHMDLRMKPFDYLVRYVTALDHFDELDSKAAKPHAGSLQAGYHFQARNKSQKVDVGYEWSRDSYNLNSDENLSIHFPFTRISASYGLVLLNNVILETKVIRDHDYPVTRGGTGHHNYGATIRLTALLV